MTSIDQILANFEQISAIPRGTKNEAGIREWLINWTSLRGLLSKTDTIGNLVIYVPASVGCENAPALILQGHLDMSAKKILIQTMISHETQFTSFVMAIG